MSPRPAPASLHAPRPSSRGAASSDLAKTPTTALTDTVPTASKPRDAGPTAGNRRTASTDSALTRLRGPGPGSEKPFELSASKKTTLKNYPPGGIPALELDEVREGACLLAERHGFRVEVTRGSGLVQSGTQLIPASEHVSNLLQLLEEAKRVNRPIGYIAYRNLVRDPHVDPYIVHPNGHIIALLGHPATRGVAKALKEAGHPLIVARPTALTEAHETSMQTSLKHCGAIALALLKQLLKDDAALLNDAMVVWPEPGQQPVRGAEEEQAALHALRNKLPEEIRQVISLILPPEAIKYSQSSRFNTNVEMIVGSSEPIIDVPPHQTRKDEHRSITLVGARAMGMKLSRLDGLPLSDEEFESTQRSWMERSALPKNRQRELMHKALINMNLYAEHVMGRIRDAVAKARAK